MGIGCLNPVPVPHRCWRQGTSSQHCAVQVLEEDGFAKPHRPYLVRMYVLDKGRGDNRRPTLLCRSFEVRWDPLSGLGELNLELWSSTAALQDVIEDPKQFMTAVVLSAPNRDRSKTLNTKTLCLKTQASMAKAGRRPRQITTADGQPAVIQFRDNVLHSMRHAGARRVLRYQQGLEAAKQLLGHGDAR